MTCVSSNYKQKQEKIIATKETTKMVLQSMIALASAALAWNDAIKETIKLLMADDESLSSKYIYAILATLIAVIIILVLAKMAAKVGGEAAIQRKAEGWSDFGFAILDLRLKISS